MLQFLGRGIGEMLQLTVQDVKMDIISLISALSSSNGDCINEKTSSSQVQDILDTIKRECQETKQSISQ